MHLFPILLLLAAPRVESHLKIKAARETIAIDMNLRRPLRAIGLRREPIRVISPVLVQCQLQGRCKYLNLGLGMPGSGDERKF